MAKFKGIDIVAFLKWAGKELLENPEGSAVAAVIGSRLAKSMANGKFIAVLKAIASNMAQGMTLKQALAAETTTAALKTLGVAAGKTVAVAAAAAFAVGTIKSAVDETGKVVNDRDLNGWQKLGKALWTTSIPGATFNQIKSFINWMNKSDNQRAAENEGKQMSINQINSKTNESAKQYVKSDGSPTVSTDVNRQPTEEENQLAKQLGMTSRPVGSGTAQYYWQKEVDRRMGKKITNHPIWYGKYKEYVTSNLQWGERKETLGFPTAAGTQLTISLMIPTTNGQVSQAFKDAVNMIYVKMRGSNSGAFNYDSVDVAAYLECVRSIRALHSQLCRDLKLVNNVDPYIIQTPDIMLSIAGYDGTGIADIKANRISYINELNQLKAVIENRYPLPPDMAVFDRAEYLATAIIEEGKGPKSSVFIYHLGALTTTKANNTRELDLVSADVASFATKLATLRTMIENCEKYATSYGPSTFAKIAGDLMKAYGNAAFRNAASITIDDKAVVAYDAYLLTQIQNGVGAQIARSEPVMATYTDAFSIVYNRDVRLEAKTGETATVPANRIYGVIDSNDSAIDLIMNCYKKEISGLEVLSLTRLVDYIKVDTTTVTPNSVLTALEYECGTEIINRIRMFIFDPTKVTGTDRYSIGSHMREATDSDAIVSVWSQIDYSPTLQIFSNSNNNGDFVNILDLDVYAHMTKRQFSIFTTTCVLSLYKTVNITDQVNFKAVKK